MVLCPVVTLIFLPTLFFFLTIHPPPLSLLCRQGFDVDSEFFRRETTSISDDDGVVEMHNSIVFEGIEDRVGKVEQKTERTGWRRPEVPVNEITTAPSQSERLERHLSE